MTGRPTPADREHAVELEAVERAVRGVAAFASPRVSQPERALSVAAALEAIVLDSADWCQPCQVSREGLCARHGDIATAVADIQQALSRFLQQPDGSDA